MASHAGTTPMDRRRDAAAAVAELALYVEQRAAARAAPGRHRRHAARCPTARSTSCPGRCRFSLDIRATTDAVRDACVADVLAELQRDLRAARRCSYTLEETMRAAAAPSAPDWQQRWERAVAVARPAAVPHAQRRRPRRDEAARGDAAGDAVRARRQLRASATTRWNPSPTTTPSSRCEAFQHLLDQLADRKTADHDHDYDQARRLDRRPLRRGGALPAGAGARAHRHAARQQRAARRAHGRAARRTSASTPSSTRCPKPMVQARGPAVDHQPDRAPPLRRRADDRAQRARRRGAAGRRLDARSLRRRDRRRQALRPRRGGEQERLRHLHLRACARSSRCGAHAARAASSCTSPTTRSSAASSAPAGC